MYSTECSHIIFDLRFLDNDKTQNRIQELEEKHFSVNEPCTVLNEVK